MAHPTAPKQETTVGLRRLLSLPRGTRPALVVVAILFLGWALWNALLATDGGENRSQTTITYGVNRTQTGSVPVTRNDVNIPWRAIAHPADIERRLLQSVRYLASDELEGRGIGTKGIEFAATYIADSFNEAGLQTATLDGSWYQNFARSSRPALLPGNRLTLTSPAGQQTLTLGRDFTPLSVSNSGTFSLPLIFIGYGLANSQQDLVDDQNVDVSNKAVVILRRDTSRSYLLPQTVTHKQPDLGTAIEFVVKQGAAAVVLCTDSVTIRRRLGSASKTSESEDTWRDHLMRFHGLARTGNQVVPIVHVRRQWIDQILQDVAGISLIDAEQRMEHEQKPHSIDLFGWTIQGEVHVGLVQQDLKNIVGSLRGTGAKDNETIVIGAHYDHVGYGGSWSSLAPETHAVHNGADDNASGTAILIELARQLANHPEPLDRRLLFVAFTAEESGLVGSQYYVDHPLVPLAQTVAMINLDMVGRLRNDSLEVYGTGTAAGFETQLLRLGHHHKIRLGLQSSGYSPSDHVSFLDRGIPSLHFFTGLHGDYHRPDDDYDKLNIRGMRRICELTRDLVVELANQPSRPHYQSQGLLADFASVAIPDLVPPATNTERLGISGAMSKRQEYLVRSIAPHGQGARLGLRVGDRILKIGDHSIRSEADYEQTLDTLAPGMVVPLTFRRGTVDLEVDLHLP